MLRVLVVGAGYTGTHVLERARREGQSAVAVVRRSEPAQVLREAGFDVHVQPAFGAEIASIADADTHVVVCFPPDGETDARVAAALPHVGAGLSAITYLSASSVYGERTGVIDDTTPVTERPTPSAAKRLAAEAMWRDRGATILRCPAIYGADRGAHVRIARGEHRIPGDGRTFVSRIHVEDLAAIVLAAPRARGETFVVGDLEPTTHAELAELVSHALGAPMPPQVPLSEVHESLRGDRRIDGTRALRMLGVTLAYPSIRDVVAR